MYDLAEIKIAIENLPEKDFFLLRKWFWEKDWEKWDKQIENDSECKKIDFIIKEALNEKREDSLEEL